MTVLAVEQKILANSLHFHALLKSAHAAWAQRKPDIAAGLAQHAAYFAWFNGIGQMVSRELEDLMLEIGLAHFPLAPAPSPLAAPPAGPAAQKVLHILTTAYGIGGHTRLARRWIEHDADRTHSLILTQQGPLPIPENLEQTVHAAGGRLFTCTGGDTDYLDRARQLRDMAEQHELIVLHTHPHDVVPLIALAGLLAGIPVLFLNHVSYVFWLGASISNLIVNLAQGCIDFSVRRRGLPRENCDALLPIPLDLPQAGKSRAAIRQQHGIGDEDLLLFSSGSAQKYTPVDGIDFRDFVRTALTAWPQVHLCVAGPQWNDYWQALADEAPGRVHPLGLIDETTHNSYYHAADIYLDSLPLGSGTSVLEAASIGLPILVFAPQEWQAANLGFEQDHIPRDLHFFESQADYAARLNQLIASPEQRRFFGNAVCALVRRAGMGPLWTRLLEDAYAKAATVQRRRPTGPALFTRIESTDRFMLRLHVDAGNARPPEGQDIGRMPPATLGDAFDFSAPTADRNHHDYLRWQEKRQLGPLDAQLHRERVATLWPRRLLCEFILAPDSDEAPLLAETIDTLAAQYYDGWQLTVLSREPSPEPEFHRDSSPVRWIECPDAAARMAAINARLVETPADWIGFFACGTRFSPNLLLALGDHAALRPAWQAIYTDADSLDADGQRGAPQFKPDFNLELLRSTDYIGGIFVRRDALLSVGGASPHADAAAYDTVLRIADHYGEHAIGHIADILQHLAGHMRQVSPDATQAALLAHFARRGLVVDFAEGLLAGGPARIRYRHPSSDPAAIEVSILIPTRNRLDLLGPCLESLLKYTPGAHWELILIDNDSDDPNLPAYYDALCAAQPDRIRLLRYPGAFDFAAMNNRAAEIARGDFLLLLNNDTVCIHDDWLDALLAHGRRHDVGIVGARLLYPDTLKVQHAGVVLGMSGTAGHVFAESVAHDEGGYLERALLDQEYSAVSGACLLIRNALYRELGGLDETHFKVSYNDIDLCLKVRERNLKIIYTPYATLLHHGSASQNAVAQSARQMTHFQSEQRTFLHRWWAALSDDPAWNRNLCLSETTPQVESELAVPWSREFHERPRLLTLPAAGMGAAEYRNIAPLRALNQAGKIHYAASCQPCAGFDRAPTPVELARMAPDTLLIHTPVDDIRHSALQQYAAFNPDVLRIFSLDDLITDLPQDNPTRRHLPPELMRERLRQGLAASDRLIVSTAPLAEACRDLIDDIRVIPNRLSLDMWGPVSSQRRAGGKLRVGWAGAQQHAGDLKFLREVVEATHREVDWVFLGMLPEGVRAYVAEAHDFVHRLNEYPAKLASLDLDLAVAPLEIHPFNEAKSNLRLLEYGYLGWPVICTDILPYQTDSPPVLRLPNDPVRWIAAIRERCAERAALAREGEALRTWVRANYILEDRLDDWLAALTR